MRGSMVRWAIFLISGTSLVLSTATGVALATVPGAQSKGQTVYAAAYSHVLMGDEQSQFPLSATLIVRNTDLANAIVLTTVDYRDSKGGHVRHYVEKPIVVDSLASVEFVVNESDETGGHSPSFIVQWEANKMVNAPVVETLMIGVRSGRGISIVGRAWVIEEAGGPQQEAEPRALTD